MQLGEMIFTRVQPFLAVAVLSVQRTVFLLANSAFAAPYVGLCLLAVLFPFVHSKGAGAASFLVAVYQTCHMVQTMKSGRLPPRMEVSLEYCPTNITATHSATNSTALTTKPQEVFFLFRLSFLWSSFFAIFATVLGGILLSALTGEMRSEAEQPHLTSDILMRIWRKCRGQPIQSDNKTSPRETSNKKFPANQAENKNLLTNESHAPV